MSVFQKLNTLLRASARESAERITDANAIRIYRQEIVDAENLLARRRDALAGLIASRHDLERELARNEQRIARREASIEALPPAERSDELLALAAEDITTSTSHLQNLRQRHSQLCSRITAEERTLRTLLTEIKEHRREARLLAADQSRGSSRQGQIYSDTVAGHLATLRQTRNQLNGAVEDNDTAEASMSEAIERIEGAPFEECLKQAELDSHSQLKAATVERLRRLGQSAAPA